MNKEVFKQLGLGPRWVLRDAPAAGEVEALPSPVESVATPLDVAPASIVAGGVSPTQTAPKETAPRRQPIGRPFASPAAAPAPAIPVARAPAVNSDVAGLDWDALEERVKACSLCRLCERRKQAVFGVGDKEADWLLVGEGPGAEEDERGEPFVGQAGKLLDAMLASLDLERGRGVYIANSVKCRPPNNRTPEAEEVAACFPYLERQIALIKPKLIIALGRPAAMALLGQEVRIGAARGQRFDYQGIPVIVTYHPAYLLRNLNDKAKSWEDLLFARRIAQAATA